MVLDWSTLTNFLDPKLIVAAVALYFVGIGLKKTEKIKDNYIPLILGGIGIVLAAIFIFASAEISTPKDIAMAIFNAIVEGIILGALPVYVNQNVKQLGSKG